MNKKLLEFVSYKHSDWPYFKKEQKHYKLVIARDHTLLVNLSQGSYLIGQPRLRIQHYKTNSFKLVITRDHAYVIGQRCSGTIPYWSAKITNSILIGC